MAVAVAAGAQPAAQRSLLTVAWAPDRIGLVAAAGAHRTETTPYELRLLDAIGERAGLGFALRPAERDRGHQDLARGAVDLLLPAIRTPAQDAAALFSAPYGRRTDVLFLDVDAPQPAGTGPALLADALRRGLRIGVVRGEEHGAGVAAILADPALSRTVVGTARLVESVDGTMRGQLDGFLAGRLEGVEAVAAYGGGQGRLMLIDDRPVAVHELHIMFSRATVDPATVAAVDRALASLHADGSIERLRARSIAPTILQLAASIWWFGWLDMIGTVAFAISGVLIARRESYSVLGALVLAALPALGGGVMRDLLVGRRPIGVLATPEPLLLVGATVLAAYVLMRLADRIAGAAPPRRLGRLLGRVRARFKDAFEVSDAIGLAAFTVIGVSVAVRVGAEPLWLWGPICAGLGGAGGGILRDVLRAATDNPALRTSLYAEVCLVWGLLLSLAVLWLGSYEHPAYLRLAVIATVLGVFATRMAVVLLGLRSPRFSVPRRPA